MADCFTKYTVSKPYNREAMEEILSEITHGVCGHWSASQTWSAPSAGVVCMADTHSARVMCADSTCGADGFTDTVMYCVRNAGR